MLIIASDHGGLELKEALKGYLHKRQVAFRDLGTNGSESVDYPDFGEKVAQAVSLGQAEGGILICGTGIGMSIVANKFPGVRAALVHDEFTARMAKEHNNANVLVLGGRVDASAQGVEMVAAWLDAEFSGGRHQRRLDKIAELEKTIICAGKI
ncbi:ribose 5-phosphate isomerase B [Desulfuromonas sp. AOP6]|uniref:ribose 5-phosphate isomerase B n=1 Tax=Desulfuromonas sp. AOP6 TaxID=1566351 RepID=UPI0012DEE193|nr:ribose 5-phosphate isomerase B [Desulfuromonas sp. AOP6]